MGYINDEKEIKKEKIIIIIITISRYKQTRKDYLYLAYLSDRLSRNEQSDWLHRCRLSIDRRQFVRARAIQHASLHKYVKINEIKIFFA